MDKEFKKRWVAALRGGQFQQITNNLHTSEGYCCLGVACQLSGQAKWKLDHKADDDVRVFSYDGSDEMMPEVVTDLLRLDSDTDGRGDAVLPVRAKPDNRDVALSTLNDDGLTFDQIADLIDYFL